ncbi:MAG: 2-C-methyl-D-erythritol 4-phosphate cytidylyltransferase [Bacteroidetes bacterium]|jgi:2-C-methyl-D-erythritol 4-phosphate cytidylyltransferase|nr:2-C-methyl-D-erythritol 4-phosphate cytidylyltransferase [Bacteroidota bacterium]
MPARRPKVFAIVPAAGSGLRLGGATRKQFLLLRSKPIIVHTLQRFEHCSDVDEVAVAVPVSAIVDMESIVSRYRLHKVSKVIVGGDQRQDSVALVLKTLRARPSDIIMVHDGVRPFIEPKKIAQSIAACKEHGAAVLAVQPKDTIRRSRGGRFFDETLDRSALWMVQTPQTFRADILQKAFRQAAKDRFYSTDEAALVERIGVRPRIVEGSYDNIKITTKEDLDLAELIHERLLGRPE